MGTLHLPKLPYYIEMLLTGSQSQPPQQGFLYSRDYDMFITFGLLFSFWACLGFLLVKDIIYVFFIAGKT